MPWEDDLSNLFGAYVNQQPLEEAVGMMLFVSEDHPEIHQLFLHAIESGMEAARHGDAAVIGIVNKSGYQVKIADEAFHLLREFGQIYRDRYQEAFDKKQHKK